MPRCSRDIKPTPLPLSTSAAIGSTEIRSIAGRLQFGEVFDYLKACGAEPAKWKDGEAYCCNTLENGTVLIGEDGSEFELPHLGCRGDQSRMCCNVVATGQMVMATGLMELKDLGNKRGWFFWDQVMLCALPAK